MVAAVNASEAVGLLGWKHLRCLAHTINLVVQDGVTPIENFRKKVKAVVGYFHRSSKGADKLRETQNRDSPGQTPLVLINEVSTRWNSTFLMFQRICKIRMALVSTIAVLGENEVPHFFTENDFLMVAETVKLLQPFFEVTVELSAQKNFSASKVIVFVSALKTSLRTAQFTSDTVTEMASKLSENLRARFKALEEQSVLSMPTFLDPRFKKRGFANDERYKACCTEVQNAVKRLIANEEREKITEIVPMNTDPAQGSSLWSKFDRDTRESLSTRTSSCSSILEVRQYIEEAQILRTECPLLYW